MPAARSSQAQVGEIRSRTGLLIEPNCSQVVAEIVTGRQLPALDPLVVYDNALPPEQHDIVGLGDRVLLELTRQFLALSWVNRTLLALKQIVDPLIGMLRVGHGGSHSRGDP